MSLASETAPIDQPWVQGQLTPQFGRFAQRFRDEHHPLAQHFSRLVINGHACGYLASDFTHDVVQEAVKCGLDCEFVCAGGGVDSNQQQLACVKLDRLSPNHQESVDRWARALRNTFPHLKWRNEQQWVEPIFGMRLVKLERTLFKLLGLRSSAIHVHATLGDSLVMIGVRGDTKSENPGMLDNLSAGGIEHHETPRICALRELHEEAGLSLRQCEHFGVLQAHPQFTVSRPMSAHLWHHETIYSFEAHLAAGASPIHKGDEVKGFHLMTVQACTDAINLGEFTPDAGLVTALAISAQSMRSH